MNNQTANPRSESSKSPRKKQQRENPRTVEINLANHKQPRLDEFGNDICAAVEVYTQCFNKGDVFTSPILASAGVLNRKSRTVKNNSRWVTSTRGKAFLTPGKQWQRNPSQGPTDNLTNNLTKSPPPTKSKTQNTSLHPHHTPPHPPHGKMNDSITSPLDIFTVRYPVGILWPVPRAPSRHAL